MKRINSYNVCFLGRTGNGKTSLTNALFGTSFPTNAHVASTKEMYSATFTTQDKADFEAISVIDTPGIGEFSNDSKYYRYYEHVASVADCIVLVMTFDRTDAPAQRLLLSLKHILEKNKNLKFVIALNHIDSRVVTDADNKYISWNEEENRPSEACQKNIRERITILRSKFEGKIPVEFEIVPVCAKRNYGLENLKDKILIN